MPRPPRLTHWFAKQNGLTGKSILLSAFAALIAIGLVATISQYTLSGLNASVIVASMGASAVLLFVAPTSPLSQPWPFVGGHLVSALIGICCARWIPDVALAVALAAGLAVLAMYYLRCIHPPGGASALLPVLGGGSVHELGFQFLVTPILLNVSIMLICALVYWRLIGVNQYATPAAHSGLAQSWDRAGEEWLETRIPFSEQNLAHAMTEMNTFIDVTKHDLHKIYARAMQHAHAQELGEARCHDAMSQPVFSVEYGTELEEVWRLFEQHDIRGVPVLDNFQRVVGIVTVSDFVHNAGQPDHAPGSHSEGQKFHIAERLALLRQRTPGFESHKLEVAGQIMTSPVITARETDRIADLAPIFTQHAIHHIPVLDGKRKLVGMLTREDVMAVRADLAKNS